LGLNSFRNLIGKAITPYLDDYSTLIEKSRLDEKLFRDPIFGFQRIKPYEVLIIDSRLFQRLRGIFQTSVAYLTYPSAIHTRFEHSINCLHLSERVLSAIRSRGQDVSPKNEAEVRLAALLHDIGHCIFSHGSEFFYRDFKEFKRLYKDPELCGGQPTEGEIINYCILTSDEFQRYLWEPIKQKCKSSHPVVREIDFKRIAQMIIGVPPGNDLAQRYLTDIVNGPLDVDKLDYLARDAYFAGVNISIDLDRLLPSLRVAEYKGQETGGTPTEELRLIVDHRGIAVVEQLLFARMVLYDTVYHHHKVRAASCLLQTILKRFSSEKVWPTCSGYINSISDLLEIDEYDFFGSKYDFLPVKDRIRQLRYRILPRRALVIMFRALANKDSNVKWQNICAGYTNRNDEIDFNRAARFFEDLRKQIVRYAKEAGAESIDEDDVMIDIPEPPGYGRLGRETLIQIVDNYVVPLERLFPFQKVVNNYSTQYKYRSYVFSSPMFVDYVAYAAYRAFQEEGIVLNDLSLILAHQNESNARDLLLKNNINIYKWDKHYYLPSFDSPENALGEEFSENIKGLAESCQRSVAVLLEEATKFLLDKYNVASKKN
jgi:HD superfamily phosphohydrolase